MDELDAIMEKYEDRPLREHFEGLDDINRFGDLSGLPVVVKGVLRGDDAAACVTAGAAAVWVSTHGGRQADPVIPSAHALPEVGLALEKVCETVASLSVVKDVEPSPKS